MRLWVIVTVTAITFYGLVIHYSRGPDYEVEWKRSVPSFLPKSELSQALKDPKSWPIFHHELKEALFFRVKGSVETQASSHDPIEKGMHVTFKMEPKAKEWKRYEIRAEISAIDPGNSISFRLLPESEGKIAKILGGYEWSFGVGEPSDRMKAKGYISAVTGESHAMTLSARARFFGRIASRTLMNQTYPVDLPRLANFLENKEAREGDYAPVYK